MITHDGTDQGKYFLARLFLAVFLFTVLQVAGSPSVSAAFKRVSRNELPPAFALEDLDGKEHTSGDLFGRKITVVVFWATWNFRSVDILTDMEVLRKELGEDRLQVIAINSERQEISAADRQKIRTMVQEKNFTSLVLIDQGLAAFNGYGAMALPSSLVLDQSGKVIFDLAGYPRSMRSDLSDAVRKALGLPTSVELRPPEKYKPKNHALQYYNFGRRLMEKGQEEKAEAQLLKALERDPEFTKPRIELGIYFKKTGRLEEALEQFRKVKELDPDNQETAYQGALVSLRAGHLEEGEALFRELHEEFPEREEFALGLALAHQYQGHEEDSRTARELAATLLPAEPRFHYELGSLAEAQGDLEEAAALYHRALEGLLNK